MNRKTIAVIMLTPACNMSCDFCVTENRIRTMSFRQAVALLKALRGRGITSVIFGGGEPLTWPHDLFRLAAVAKGLGFLVQIGTNGIALPRNFERIESVDRYVLPIESMDPSVHDGIRRYKGGHHAVIMERMGQMRRGKRPATISTVVTGKNKNGLGRIAEFLRTYQGDGGVLHAWHLYRFIPQGRGGGLNGASLSVTSEAYDEACRRIKGAFPDILIYKRKSMLQSKTVDFFWSEGDKIGTIDIGQGIGEQDGGNHSHYRQ